jgi:hypothetical protein
MAYSIENNSETDMTKGMASVLKTGVAASSIMSVTKHNY